MKFWVGVLGCVVLAGCGGLGDDRNEVRATLTGSLTPSFGVSVDTYDSGSTTAKECRDDRGDNWCSVTTQADYKEVRFYSNEPGYSHEDYEIYVRNNDTVSGVIRVRVGTRGIRVVDRTVTIAARQKVLVGYVDRDGNFDGRNGF